MGYAHFDHRLGKVVRTMDPGCAARTKYKEVLKHTDNFSKENFVGTFQFGKVYRGKFPVFYPRGIKDSMVKIWEVPEICQCSQGANVARMMNEYFLLQHERLLKHPGMIEFDSYCWDGVHLCAVYNFSPLDTVHNLVPSDNFTWLQRMKVALGIARLLKFLHAGGSSYKPFLVRNIAAAHVVVDEEYNPKLYDFGMISGGIFPDRTMYECKGFYGYVDPNIDCSGNWSKKSDVFAFGVLLLNLITKRVDIEGDSQSNAPLLYSWAWGLFESCESEKGSRKSPLSLVDDSLTMDPEFSVADGHEITDIAMKCISRTADERPTMKQVVKHLMKLQATKKHPEYVGLASEPQAGVDY